MARSINTTQTIIVTVFAGIGVWLLLEVYPGEKKPDTKALSLSRIAGNYAFGPDLCNDPANVVEITDFGLDFHEDLETNDIAFEEVGFRGLIRPSMEPAPAYIGIWDLPKPEVRSTILVSLSESNLRRLGLPSSASDSRTVLAYTEYDLNALNDWSTIDQWAPELKTGYTLFPCN